MNLKGTVLSKKISKVTCCTIPLYNSFEITTFRNRGQNDSCSRGGGLKGEVKVAIKRQSEGTLW